MKFPILCLTLLSAPAFAAAPDSLAGKVYRQTTDIPSIRQTTETTVVFGADGRFTSLKYGTGSPLTLAAPNQIFLQSPKADGAYTYTKLSETSASANMTFDDGTKQTWTFTFNAGYGGSFPDSEFTLTDATGATAPVANISLRGRVAPGQPLIAGFVVPGPAVPASSQFLPSASVQQREALIRVIGPSLDQFGVANRWADPDFKLYQDGAPANVNEVHYADWGVNPTAGGAAAPSPTLEAAFRKVFNYVGAFPLPSGSKDAADVVRLNPGAYTVVCSPAAGDAGGEVLIEVYFLP